MSNLLVYFWRWATWKVLENAGNSGGESPGVVCLVTTAAWLSGDGFQQMRAWLRQWCSEIWVVSLSPEGHQPDVPTRMFEQVQHEIAVVCAVRSPETDETPATVWFREVTPGTRSDKFAELETIGIDSESAATWSQCPHIERAPFKPAGEDFWRSCPSIRDLLPWSSPGVLANRGWPTSPDADTLASRWSTLVGETDSERKRQLFEETQDRRIDRVFAENLPHCQEASGRSLALEEEPCPIPIRLAWGSFDRQWIIPDKRVSGPAPTAVMGDSRRAPDPGDVHRSRPSLQWTGRHRYPPYSLGSTTIEDGVVGEPSRSGATAPQRKRISPQGSSVI